MALTAEQTALLAEKYGRERDRYGKMAQLVQRHLQAALRDRVVRCVVTARAKHPDSLVKKLQEDPELAADALRGEFNPTLLDVAGARVMLYEYDRDADRVVRAIEEVFEVPDGPRFQRDHGLRETRCYQARHRVVRLRSEQLLDPDHENLKGVMCEIQIVSLVKHVWNELQHDVGYKDAEGLGEPSVEQNAWLQVLWDSLQAAETAVGHLSRVTDERRTEKHASEKVIEDGGELRLALVQILNAPVEGDMGTLFRLLNITERSLSPSALVEMGLGRPDALAAGAEAATAAGIEEPDEVECLVAYLCRERAPDFKEISSGWLGPRTRIRRIIEAASATKEVSS